MLGETEYKEALWERFIRCASMPGRWGSGSIPNEVREHLLTCGIDVEESSDIEAGKAWQFDTFNPDASTPAYVAEYWCCKCGEYGTDRRKVRNPQPHMEETCPPGLGDLIAEVIKVADRRADRQA